MGKEMAPDLLICNFWNADWGKFTNVLRQALANQQENTDRPSTDPAVSITIALQQAIKELIPHRPPIPRHKRWWNNVLMKWKKERNKLRTSASHYHALTHHLAHSELRQRSE